MPACYNRTIENTIEEAIRSGHSRRSRAFVETGAFDWHIIENKVKLWKV